MVVGLAIISVSGAVYVQKKRNAVTANQCPVDLMLCPDGSTIARSGPACEFGVCKEDRPSYMRESATVSTTTPFETTISTSSLPGSVEKNTAPLGQATPSSSAEESTFKKAVTVTTTAAKQVASTIINNIPFVSNLVQNTPSQQTTESTTQNNQQEQASLVTPLTSSLNETRYEIKGNTIVDNNNNVIYILPAYTSSSGTETSAVNAVAVNAVAPIIGAIPVTGLPGKYYLSENTIGTNGGCIFSNRIYILDINTGVKVLMYEENNTTINENDPRACTSEIFLLATDREKLIVKYHTIGTEAICESSWSEPEKTWYIDVTKISEGMKRFYISPQQYYESEAKEAQCRALIEATSTIEQPPING